MSKNRELYFEKYIKGAKTPEDMMRALRLSPYKTHRRQAVLLKPAYNNLTASKAAVKKGLVDENPKDN